MFSKGHVRFLAAVVAVLCAVVPWAALAFENSAVPGPSGTRFTGGTVPSAVVFTGDNSGGTGTVRIRPSDEDLQLVLCEASNNASPEVCSVMQHANFSSALSYDLIMTNYYLDSAAAYQRYNTSFGGALSYTQAGSSNASNSAGWQVRSTNNTISGGLDLSVTGAGTSTFTSGLTGTVTNDFRGPILNGGSATCNGILAGNLCVNDDTLFYSANGVISTQASAATAATGVTFYSSAGSNTGAVFFGNASISDPDLVSKVVLRGVSSVVGVHRTDNVADGSPVMEVMDNTAATGVTLMTLLGDGTIKPLLYGSQSNCSDGAGAAACSAAPVGGVVIDAAATTVVVSTTAVTANSRIMLQEDTSLALTGSPTCNTDAGRTYRVTARTAGTSFTITASAAPVTNPACLSYSIIN